MTEPTTAPARRRVLLVVAGALAVLGLVLGGAGLLGADPPAPAAAVAADPLAHDPAHRRRGTPPAAGHRVSPGRRLDIPAIDVSSPVDSVGLNPDGTLEVPVPGPALRPRRLVPRLADARDGSARRWSSGTSTPPRTARRCSTTSGGCVPATGSRSPRRTGRRAPSRSTPCAPTRRTSSRSLEVYGDTAGPELRLITCGGDFDDAARSYRDNTVVFARLVT